MYTSVNASLDAIRSAEHLLEQVSGQASDPITPGQVAGQLRTAVDRVMAEGSLYDPPLAALAVQQAEGDLVEAAFLLRAYRSTLPRSGYSLPSDTDQMRVLRRVSATHQDIPGGQLLGKTRDYSLRLLEIPGNLAHNISSNGSNGASGTSAGSAVPPIPRFQSVVELLRAEGYLPPSPPPANLEPFDVTREPLRLPASRAARLQIMARGDAGAMLSLAYSAMRGYGLAHAYVSEVRQGEIPVCIAHPVTGRRVRIGRLPVTEAHVVFPDNATLQNGLPDFTYGYGITVGSDERKAISMGIVDDNLTHHAGQTSAPVQDEEFVLHHIDCVEASGFVEHLKLPHYVSFQADKQRSSKIGELLKAAGRHD